ncbi:amidohydrolase family protein [Parvularcula sp. ZS-1/3]|uniref:Amidohydrolase family protein n=1 Tax=Parvularcula mediterranea TaxID=2732508 RepID=A0A7Y3RM55_9PROT|nr:amidohydrolase family protein [Parvularcula mediterranea]NNU16140.1 amidohydrolase family protein [Parvularcula mediterranea]
MTRRDRGSALPILMGLLASTALSSACADDHAAKSEEQEKEAPLSLEGKTEKLNFNVEEGTWLSLTLGPDDGRIIFDLLGDLYQIPKGGGEAERFTSGLGFDSQPALSPDGTTLAFISDREGEDDLWVSDADGENARKISSVGNGRILSPAWSPDGQFILVSEIGSEPGLTMYHVDGGSGVALMARPASGGDAYPVNGAGAAFSPDGRYVYYASPTGGSYPGAQIHRLDRQTGVEAPITQLEGGAMRPVVSPDGEHLAYITRDESETRLRVRNLRTGADRQIISGLQRDAQEQRRAPSRDYYPSYAFTAESDAIIIGHDGAFAEVGLEDGSVDAIAFSAEIDLDIGPDLTAPYAVDEVPVRARIIHDPVLSPGKDKIAASILGGIYVTDAEEGAEPRKISPDDVMAFVPTWSPDGRHIAFVTWSDIGGGYIWRMPADGSAEPRRLTDHAAYYTDLDWSPDGQTLVAMRGNEWTRHRTFSEFGGLDTPMEFISLPAQGGEVTVLRPASDGERDPHFGEASDRVFAYSGEALFSMTLSGADMIEHLTVDGPKRRQGGDPNYAEQIRIRPNGEWAVALMNGQVWVVPVAKLGATIPQISVRGPSLPIARLTDIGADFVGWSDDGSDVVWAIGSTFYRRPFDEIAFAPPAEDEGEEEASDESAVPEEHPSVLAQKLSVTVPRNVPEGAVLLSGATVITMDGDDTEEMAEGMRNADILIVGDRIEAIGQKGSLDVPEDAERIDLRGKFVIPGLLDTHAHWEFRTQDVLEPHNWSLAANLAYGVTAGLDVQTAHKDYFTYRDWVDAGVSVGQRAFMTGPGIFANNQFQSYERTHAYLRRYSDHYETKNIKAYLTGNRQQRHWVVRASQDLGLMPTTEGGADMKMDITHAIDGMHGNEHNLPITPLREDVVKLYAETKTAYTATLLVQYQAISALNWFFTNENPHDDEKLARFYPENRIDELTRRRGTWARDDEYAFKQAAADVAAIQRAGGLVGIGGHAELQGLGFHWEMRIHEMGGMTPEEVLRAATIDGATIIGVEGDLGSIEEGKLADLVVLNSDPRKTIENAADIHYVMKGGELYDDETLTRVWPSEKKLEPFWWTDSPD